MITSMDDLQVGSWVTVVSVHSKPITVDTEFGEKVLGVETPDYWTYSVNGIPYQIIEIQLPFVVMYCQVVRTLFTLDKRLCEFMLMSESYVKTFTTAQPSKSSLLPAALPKNIFQTKANGIEWSNEESWKNPTWLCRSCGLPLPSTEGQVPDHVCQRCASPPVPPTHGQ